jgi:hypothetical protein
MKQFVAVPLPCAWIHPDALEIDTRNDNVPGCPECGKLLNWGHCWFCNTEFLIFGTGGDDVMADASITLSGDLMCFPCAVEVERQEQEEDDTEASEEG